MGDQGVLTGKEILPNQGPRGLVDLRPASVPPRFSLCCMVTRQDEYAECLQSFAAGGFGEDCEILTIDNSGENKADAYVALNEFLQTATAEFIVLHHQDILLLEHDRSYLEARLDELTKLDPQWAIASNAGRTSDGWPAISIAHPFSDRDVRGGPFPVRVCSVDENFIVVRRVSNLALSADLQGFHHYGVDLCTIADILGWRPYVIDFFLKHKSGGNFDHRYDESMAAIRAKYARALRPRWGFLITGREFILSGSKIPHASWGHLRNVGKALGLVPRNSQLQSDSFIQSKRRGRKR